MASPGATGGPSLDRPHEQVQAALARWAASAGGATSKVVFVGDLTSQIGDWEASVGDNDKVALIQARYDLPRASRRHPLAPGEDRWPDGTSVTVELRSAGDALAELARSGAAGCDGCRPLEITGARLTTGRSRRHEDRRPVRSGVQGRREQRGHHPRRGRGPGQYRAAAVGSERRPQGISIDSARGDAGSRDLTVSFIGAPAAGDQPCGADYVAEAVESELAVVVIVTEHPNPVRAACSLVGALRTAAATSRRHSGAAWCSSLRKACRSHAGAVRLDITTRPCRPDGRSLGRRR